MAAEIAPMIASDRAAENWARREWVRATGGGGVINKNEIIGAKQNASKNWGI